MLIPSSNQFTMQSMRMCHFWRNMCCHSFKLHQRCFISRKVFTEPYKYNCRGYVGTTTISHSHRCYSSKSSSGYNSDIDLHKQSSESLEGDLRRELENVKSEDPDIPKETDIAIIGGGSFGLSTAYWLKKVNPSGCSIVVVERDPTYTGAWTTRGLASISHQFSLKEYVEMGMFSAEFYRDMNTTLNVLDLDPPDIQFNPQGYLLLASDDRGSQVLQSSYETQRECKAHTELLHKDQLQSKFPWMTCDDVTLASYGLANEGWFDPWMYLTALKVKCMSLGVKFVKGEVCGFKNIDLPGRSIIDGKFIQLDKPLSMKIRVNDQVSSMQFAIVVNCAGPWAGEVARMAGIGAAEDGPLSTALPVEPRKRFVYVFHCPEGPGFNMPMLIDSSGVYVRREGLGGHYICGATPIEEPSTANLDVDYAFFNDHIWPLLAKRVPAFEKLKLKSAWAGFYDYNSFDQNLIIGNHPRYRNFFMAAGCSGHGIQQSPAIGRAMMEYILEGDYTSIDLSRFSFDRIIENTPVLEDTPFII